MSEERRLDARCLAVSHTDSETPRHSPAPSETVRDSSKHVSIKTLAAKVLSEAATPRQDPDTARQQVSHCSKSEHPILPTEIEPTDDPLFDSMKRLEVANISIAILDDGTMRVVQTNDEAADAIERGFSIYSPRDMYYFVQLPRHERIVLHDMKRRFGGTTEWGRCRRSRPSLPRYSRIGTGSDASDTESVKDTDK